MLIEMHLLQNHAPSNLNRDDTGSPKDCVFGGVLRARISSQCLKRSIRRSTIFDASLKGHLGKRTRKLPEQVRSALLRLGCSESDAAVIAKKTAEFGRSSKKDAEADGTVETAGSNGKATEPEKGSSAVDDALTRQLIFMAPGEIEALAGELKGIFEHNGRDTFAKLKIEDIEKQLGRRLPRSVDIALFGRMTTSAAFEDVQASMQVAHALSTGKLEKQFDYFTAVDDLVEEADENGAGMIGDVEFNAATYYKYFSLTWEQFVASLGGEAEARGVAEEALDAFIRAAALTTPTGKQNSFAAHNPPDAILIEVKRENVPVSYANAFVKPIWAGRNGDVVEQSIEALSTYSEQLKKAYDLRPVASLCLTVRGQAIAGARRVDTLSDLVKETLQAVRVTEAAGAAGTAP